MRMKRGQGAEREVRRAMLAGCRTEELTEEIDVASPAASCCEAARRGNGIIN